MQPIIDFLFGDPLRARITMGTLIVAFVALYALYRSLPAYQNTIGATAAMICVFFSSLFIPLFITPFGADSASDGPSQFDKISANLETMTNAVPWIALVVGPLFIIAVFFEDRSNAHSASDKTQAP